MVSELDGEDVSLWVATTRQTTFPKLNNDTTIYDVAVVGGGITGIAAAFYMQQAGLKVVLIEKNRIVEWTTGGTTAKLSSQHYLIYNYLIDQHGRGVAQAFADANQAGIDEVEAISEKLGIDSDFSRRSSYVFTNQTDKVQAIQDEVEAARSLGLPADLMTEIELPFDVRAAIRFKDQAQFHPRKFLLPLADKFVEGGGTLYEHTEVTDIAPGEPHSLSTEHGEIKAKAVFQASGEPFWGGEILDGHMWIKMSYGLAVTLKNSADYPEGMYITTDEPLRTIRSADDSSGQVLIFGGESHEYDESDTPEQHYKNLIEDVHRRYDVDKVLYRWLAGDYMPYDRLPYIGALPDHPSIYIATGYRAWGLAWAMSAARAVTDSIVGTEPQWLRYFRLDRPVGSEEKNSSLL